MKKTFALLSCLSIINICFSQWTTSGINIYNNNTGKVGIGNTAPVTLLDIGNGVKSTLATSRYPNILGMQTRTNNPSAVPYQNFLGNMFYTSQNGSNNYMTLTGVANWVSIGVPAGIYNGVSATEATVECTNGNLGGAAGFVSQIIGLPGTNIGSFSAFSYNGAGANVGNSYGLYIGASLAKNKYGVYVTDENAFNYFGGTVGIGTQSIGKAKLAVEGKIVAREVQVTATTPFPDYVFDQGYMLMKIDTLYEFIKQNKHLPNMPSADVVKMNGGIELGNMNIKLLEKIEELTLYMIDVNKKIEKLEKENQKLKVKKIR